MVTSSVLAFLISSETFPLISRHVGLRVCAQKIAEMLWFCDLSELGDEHQALRVYHDVKCGLWLDSSLSVSAPVKLFAVHSFLLHEANLLPVTDVCCTLSAPQ